MTARLCVCVSDCAEGEKNDYDDGRDLYRGTKKTTNLMAKKTEFFGTILIVERSP